MTAAEYRRMKEIDLLGRKAVTTRQIANHHGSIARGTVVTIKGKWKGLTISSPKCEACGSHMFFREVEPAALNLIPLTTKATP